MPLRHRLLGFIAALLIASLLVGSYLKYRQALAKIELEMSSAISVAEHTVRDAVGQVPPGKMTFHEVERIVTSFNGDRHVRAEYIIQDGSVAVQSRPRLSETPAPHWLLNLLAVPPHRATIAVADNSARIQLTSDIANEVAEVWDDSKLKLVIIGVFCALVSAMMVISLGRVLKPLKDLSNALQKVGSGDYEVHVDESGPEELAAIYRGFNTMATKLAAAEQRNRQLNEQLNTVQDEERAEIARDLHDEVGPFLFAVDVDAQTIAPLLERAEHDEVLARTQAIRQSVGHMQTHLRSILQRLRPGTLLDLGLAHAADQLAEFWRSRYPGIKFDVACTDESFGGKADEAAYRVLQEGTSNAVRHGKPTNISLSARKLASGALEVSVTDNGLGIRPAARKGLGLAGMRDRIALLGGTMTVDTGPDGRGVTLRAEFPAPQNLKSASALQREEVEQRL